MVEPPSNVPEGAPAVAQPKLPKAKPSRPRPRPERPTELQRLESKIERHETLVSDLERRLAEDWADADTLDAHRRARDELQALIAEWEVLFERAQAPT